MWSRATSATNMGMNGWNPNPSARGIVTRASNVEAVIQSHGQAVFGSLFRILGLQGFYCACAGITLPNPGSIGLHEAMGFTPVGVYRAVGYKLGAWHDVGWWQLELRPRAGAPAGPIDLAAARASAAWAEALTAGQPVLRLPGG